MDDERHRNITESISTYTKSFNKPSPDSLYRINIGGGSARTNIKKRYKRRENMALRFVPKLPPRTRRSVLTQSSSGSEESASEMSLTRESPASARARVNSGKRKPNPLKSMKPIPRYLSGSTDEMCMNLKGIRAHRRRPKPTPVELENQDSQNGLISDQPEQMDPEEKNLQFLTENLEKYSRQRLRAVHMSLRHYSNVEARVTQKDLHQAFLDNNVKLANRTFQLLIDKFEDHQGIDYEKLYRYMKEAHSRSGRDSVVAMRCRNDLNQRQDITLEQRDAELLRRLEEQLVKDNTFFELTELRDALQNKDKDKTGRVYKDDVFDICGRLSPLYGALLKSLVKRCDGENTGMISWPEFLSFLEKSQESAWKKHPEMAELPEKAKEAAKNRPDPIIELSESCKSKLMSKLLKKSRGLKANKQGNNSEVKKSNDTTATSTVTGSNSSETEAKDSTGNDSKLKQTDAQPTANGNTKVPAQPEPIKEVDELKEKSAIEKTGKDSSREEDKPVPKDEKQETDAIPFSSDDSTLLSKRRKEEIEHIGKMEKEKALLKAKRKEKAANASASKDKKEKPEQENATKENKEKHEQDKSTNEKTEQNNDNKENKENVEQVNANTNGTENVEKGNSGTSYSREVQHQEKDGTNKENKVVKQAEKKVDPYQRRHEEVSVTSDFKSVSIRCGEKTVTFDKPKDFNDSDHLLDPPQERLALDWVYGYRGNDCRSNIHPISDDEIVYFVSKIAIIYDRTSHRQRHYREHTEDIKCIAVHSNHVIIATGQFAGHEENVRAHIRVWRADSMQTMFIFGEGVFEKAVMCLAFANETDILASVDNSPEKSLVLWDVSNGSVVGETPLSTDVVCDIGFNWKYPEILVTTGKEHITWWKIYPESSTVQQYFKPDFEMNLKAKYFICLTHNDRGDLITGDSNGTIYVWGDGGNKITNFIKHAHEGPVFTILWHRGHIITGGRDANIHCWVWNKTMDRAGTLQIPKSEGGVRMLQFHQETLLIGTTMNSMLSSMMYGGKNVPLQDATLDAIPITQGHFDDLRGLTSISRTEIGGDFITAGLDGIICWYDSMRKDPVCKLVLKGQQFVCLDCSPSGQVLALGTKSGHLLIIVIEGESSSEVLNQKICKTRINTIKFSPDCKHIAVGSHDCGVYLFALKHKEEPLEDAWEMLGKFTGHSGPVASIDWSETMHNDSYLIRSCSHSFECIKWSIKDLEKVDDNKTSDVKWKTNHASLDFNVAGLWSSKQAKESIINCVDVNQDNSLVAMGDSNGYLSLFRYPCIKQGMFCHTYKSHTSVYNVLFINEKPTIIAIGGKDACVLQWTFV